MCISHSVMEGQRHNNPLTRVAFVYNGPKEIIVAVAKALGGSFKLVTLAPKTVREMTQLQSETHGDTKKSKATSENTKHKPRLNTHKKTLGPSGLYELVLVAVHCSYKLYKQSFVNRCLFCDCYWYVLFCGTYMILIWFDVSFFYPHNWMAFVRLNKRHVMLCYVIYGKLPTYSLNARDHFNCSPVEYFHFLANIHLTGANCLTDFYKCRRWYAPNYPPQVF